MKKGFDTKKAIKFASNFFLFFAMIAFVITCCLTLFITVLQNTMGITFTSEDISLAAKATMINVIFISVVAYAIDLVRRKITVQRPIKMITEATESMISGNFDVRIKPVAKVLTDDTFNEMIDCINRMAKEFSGVETLRTDFIANVSHEMKTPLAVIRNYGTLLQSEELSYEKRIEYAKVITESSRRLADMMTNILKLNRLENQQIYPNLSTFDLGEQLCECLLQYENVWEDKDINIDTDIAENVLVSADRELLSLVWNNLFSNAFKFTPNGGTVSLSLRTENGHAVIKVKDTGCGMTQEVGEHIFEKFYQGDTSHATQGNGLGLALVKRVVDIMRGEISVESTVGKGSEFTVKIGKIDDVEKAV